MAALAARAHGLRVQLSHMLPTALHAATCDLAVLTGTRHFTWSASQIAALGRYLRHGGMLLGDAAGGKSRFTDSFVKLIKSVFPHVPLVPIPLTASLLTGKFPDGMNVTRVHYRKFVAVVDRLKTHPRLLGIKWHGRWTVVYSQYDITSGFLGTDTWGISGYAPASAQALAAQVMLYDWAYHHLRH